MQYGHQDADLRRKQQQQRRPGNGVSTMRMTTSKPVAAIISTGWAALRTCSRADSSSSGSTVALQPML